MNNLKERLRKAGLVGSFGQPINSGLSEDLCWSCEDSCSSCTSCSTASCSSSCSAGGS